MGFSLNNLGDILSKIGNSTLQTGVFYGAAKVMNQGFGGNFSIWGCRSFSPGQGSGYHLGFPANCGFMPNFGMNSYGYGLGMYDYHTQMAFGQAYGQGAALAQQLMAQAANSTNPYQMMFPQIQGQNLSVQSQALPQQVVNIKTNNELAEKFENHSTKLGAMYEQNTQSGVSTRFVKSDWNSMTEGVQKDSKYTEYVSNFGKSFLAHMDSLAGNKDNEVTLEEFTAYNQKVDLDESADESMKNMIKDMSAIGFEKLDQNGDAKIDWKEMSAAFTVYDTMSDSKKDGIISADGQANVAAELSNPNSLNFDNAVNSAYNRLFKSENSDA